MDREQLIIFCCCCRQDDAEQQLTAGSCGIGILFGLVRRYCCILLFLTSMLCICVREIRGRCTLLTSPSIYSLKTTYIYCMPSLLLFWVIYATCSRWITNGSVAHVVTPPSATSVPDLRVWVQCTAVQRRKIMHSFIVRRSPRNSRAPPLCQNRRESHNILYPRVYMLFGEASLNADSAVEAAVWHFIASRKHVLRI